MNGSSLHMVSLAESSQTTPLCCSYSEQGTGFPCLHGAAVIAEKYGSTNVHIFIDRRHLTFTWKEQYKDMRFRLPEQAGIDQIFLSAKKLVALDNHLQVRKALASPEGDL